jgi:hypothetical protein
LILLISASWVARLTGLSHRRPASWTLFLMHFKINCSHQDSSPK